MGEFASPGEEIGKRLLPHVVESLGINSPHKTFATYHDDGDDYRQGWSDLNFQQLSQAVDWTSWWIEKTAGKSTTTEVVAYMGKTDLRYAFFTIASIKTGHPILLPSPRNSLEGHLHLIKETGCKDFFYSSERRGKIHELKAQASHVRFWEVPTVAEILAERSEPYPFTKTYDAAEREPAIIIHSSGSTGLPKLVPMTNGYIGVQDKFSLIPETEDCRRAVWTVMAPDERSLCINPLYHLMGLYMFQESIFHGIPVVIGPDRPITAEILTDIITTTRPTIAILPPSLIEELSRSDEGKSALSYLRTTISGGAALSPLVAKRVSELTRLASVYGTSEIGVVACLIPKSKDDYKYVEWHPAYGLAMEPIGDGLFEAVVWRKAKSEFHAVFHSFPELEEYRTQDLFTKHPFRDGLWLYNGRRDDVIVLSNGEKFNPINMEKHVEEHPSVHRALVLGQARFQSSLLIEPKWEMWDNQQTKEGFIESIWPYVEEGNKHLPTHGQVMQSHICVATREKPFKLTPKGSIQRKTTLSKYTEEIDEIYTRGESLDGRKLPENPSLEQITTFILEIVKEAMPDFAVSTTSDLFSAGLDSLQTLRLATMLQGAIGQLDDTRRSFVTAAKLYNTPTIAKIADFVYDVIYDDMVSKDMAADIDADLDSKLDGLIDKYTADLPPFIDDIVQPPSKHTVILTGSTGFLGTYILDRLLRDPRVACVYCLNRSADALARAKESFQQKELSFPTEMKSRLIFWQANFGENRFGLDEKQYTEVRQNVDIIIHNAWKVDFNHSLESFEQTHIAGVRRLVDFSHDSPRHPHLAFISSVSTIGRFHSKHGASCPEASLPNTEVVVPSGYGLSKFVAERILDLSSQKCGIPTTIIRVGQIGGPSYGPGYWNKQDWVPIVLKSSKELATIPDSLSYMPIDWVPVNLAANAIVEMIETRQSTQADQRCEVFHLINPTPTSWRTLLPAIHRHLAVKVVSFAEWVNMVKEIPITDEAIVNTPAVKLVDFLQGLAALSDWKQPPWETIRARTASQTMRQLQPVGEELMDVYLRQWKF